LKREGHVILKREGNGVLRREGHVILKREGHVILRREAPKDLGVWDSSAAFGRLSAEVTSS